MAKIAFLSTFYPYRGGIAQFNAQLYRTLEGQGHQLKVWNFSLQYPSLLFPGTTQYVNENDKADAIPSVRSLNSINPVSYISTANQILDFAPDILIIRFWMPFFAPSLGYVAGKLKKKGTKVIAVIDNLIPHEPRLGDKQLTDYFLKRCDGYLVMSDVVENDLKKVKPDAKYIFHPHPIYDHFGAKLERSIARKKLNIEEGQKVLLYFGLIRKYKGLDILLDAFNELNDSYTLLAVGEPYEDFAPYQALIDKNKNKDRIITVTEYVSDEEVPVYFSAADVSVLPYRSATQSGVVAISYHFDVPVIVTDVGGLKGSVAPYGAGIVVDKPDSTLILEAIHQYFDGNNQSEMSTALQQFKEGYSWENLATELVDFAGKC
ncbi:glycosyltransferase [Limibacter armeniacum]|uniref:glycosyltransferase n=1 Tax=Limibacter armeniacum TaxID=466084 RepID=UPI002FE57054